MAKFPGKMISQKEDPKARSGKELFPGEEKFKGEGETGKKEGKRCILTVKEKSDTRAYQYPGE